MFRKRIHERGYPYADIIAPAPLSLWLPALIGVVVEIITLAVLAFSPDLSGSLHLSVPVVFMPMIIYWIGRKPVNIRGIKYLNPDGGKKQSMNTSRTSETQTNNFFF